VATAHHVWWDVTSRITDPRSQHALAHRASGLLHAHAVRARAQRLLALALDGRLEDWMVDLDRLAPTADFVAGVVRERYPQLSVPVHSRWRHFVFGNRDLWSQIVVAANWKSAAAAARSAFDLAITSVLLDAGAGDIMIAPQAWSLRVQRDSHSQACAGLRAAVFRPIRQTSLEWMQQFCGLSTAK